MSKDTVNLPSTRSWRDIPQQVRPRAMSRGGMRRAVFSGFRTALAVTVLALLAVVIYFGVQMLGEHPQPMTKITNTAPVSTIALSTDGVLDEAWIRGTLALPKNITLMEVDLVQLRDRLVAGGQVQTATLTRRFPSTLAVTISERVPVARIMAQLGDSAPRELLVARDGVVYGGIGYEQAITDSLPWLAGVKLVRSGQGFEPLPGMAIAAELLATARNEAPHLYANWQVLSLARLASDGEIEVQATDVERVVFGKSESFFRQLAQLDVLLDFVQAHPEKPLREINLAVARVTDGYSQVPVALDLPDRASPSRPPPAVTTPSPLPLFNLQKKTPREF